LSRRERTRADFQGLEVLTVMQAGCVATVAARYARRQNFQSLENFARFFPRLGNS
jgi:hypothetical protein